MRLLLTRLVCLILAVTYFLVTPDTVMALSPEQKKVFQSGLYSFDVATGATESDVCETGTTTLSGNSNIAKAFNYFVDQGLSPDQSAGIVGNLIAESGVFPARKQGKPTSYIATMDDINEAIRLNKADASTGFGIGIAQWTSWNRLQNLVNYAGDKSPLTLEVQLPYLYEKELPSNGLNELKAATDLRQATWIFLAFFERPAVVVAAGKTMDPVQPTSGAAKDELDNRARNAQEVLGTGGSGSGEDAPVSDCGFTGGALDGNEESPDYDKNYNVVYDGPPAGSFSESKCTSGFTPGAQSLSNLIMKAYSPPVTSVGGFSCRQNTNDDSVSIHGVGRALDIMIDSTTPKGKEVGDRIRNLMINNAEQIGVQLVIWDRHIWSVNNKGWRVYDGPNPHIDHLHVEINIKASENPNLGQ